MPRNPLPPVIRIVRAMPTSAGRVRRASRVGASPIPRRGVKRGTGRRHGVATPYGVTTPDNTDVPVRARSSLRARHGAGIICFVHKTKLVITNLPPPATVSLAQEHQGEVLDGSVVELTREPFAGRGEGFGLDANGGLRHGGTRWGIQYRGHHTPPSISNPQITPLR